MARWESLTSYAMRLVQLGEDLAGGSGTPGFDVVYTLLQGSVEKNRGEEVFGVAVERERPR